MQVKTKISSSIIATLIVASVIFILNRNQTVSHNILQPNTSQAPTLVEQLSNVNEYQDTDGRTIIKNAVPESLKGVEQALTELNKQMDDEIPTLQQQKEELFSQTSDIEALDKEVQEVLQQAQAEGADNAKIEAEFNTMVDAPISPKPSTQLANTLKKIDKEAMIVEEKMQNLNIVDDSIFEENPDEKH